MRSKVDIRGQRCLQPIAGEDTAASRGTATNIGPKNIAASGDLVHVGLPPVYRVASLLKRWWLGTVPYKKLTGGWHLNENNR